jgi:hypothetical protein
MEPTARAISWEAPEHHHVEKGNDWFFALIIIVLALVITAILFNNVLLALLLGIAGGVLGMAAARVPRIVPFAVSVHGVKIEDELHPFSSLGAYHIDEEDPRGPQLLLRSEKMFMPLIVIPIPVDYIDDIELLLKDKLPEEELEEPFLLKVLELFGF